MRVGRVVVLLCVGLVVLWMGMMLLGAWLYQQRTPQVSAVLFVGSESLAQAASEVVIGPPTVTAAFINQVLATYHSPAAGKGQALYDLGVQYGIDPVFALAFFLHESRFGTQGEATKTLALGNERCIPDRLCVDQARGGYAQMQSWEDGFAHWYRLIRDLYIRQWGCRTIAQIVPRYAPSQDGNDVNAYMAAIVQAVATWRRGQVWV